MNLRACTLFLFALLHFAFPRSLAAPQSVTSTPAASPKPADDRVKLNVDLVLLDAQVVQRKTARIVGGLKREDFVLREDGVAQQITQFGQDSLPLSVILLVDRGGCLDPFSNQVRQATLDALERLKPTDEVALMAFADTADLIKGFRYDRRMIADALDRLPPHDENAGHCFNRAFYEAAKFMGEAGNPAGRRVIIMITGITKSFDCHPGPSGEETRNEVLESGAVVCGLVPITAEQRLENGIIGGAATVAGVFKANTLSLGQLAEETGGEIFSAKAPDLDAAFSNLIDHLRNRYTIGFVSSNTKRDGTYRKLKLEVAPAIQKREGDVVVKTRRGYKAAKGAKT
jgi:Ca-activated chloride channel family protein